MTDADNVCWLDAKKPEDVAAAMVSRINRYAERMEASGRVMRWRAMSRLHYSRDPDSNLHASGITSGGAQGELLGTRGNMLGRYNRAVQVLVTGSRPSYSARSIGSSSKAISQVSIANALLDFVLSKRGAEAAARRAELYLQLYGQGWVSATWDERAGRPVGIDELGRQRFEGDICIRALRPDEVVYDVDLDENTPHEWVIVSRQVSRWKLIGQYPQFKDHILSTDTRTRLEDIRDTLRLEGSDSRGRRNGDLVTVYELHAPPSVIVPKGRYAMLLGDKLIALDRALYDDLAHYEMVAEYEPGTRNGHSFLWDLIGPQQAADAALVSLISCIENYGRPVLFSPSGNTLNVSKDKSMQAFHTVEGVVPPSFVSLDPGILAPLIAAREQYYQDMTAISGLNDAALGDAGKSQSGEALATMHSLALQSVSSVQAGYADGFGALMFGTVLRYRAFGSDQQIMRIAGKTYAGDVAKFMTSVLSEIDSIDVEMGAASMRHAAGRKEYADKLFAQRVVDPEQYLEAQATGTVEPILGRPRSQRALIEAENERLRAGQPVFVSPTDDDRFHINQHSIIPDDAELRVPLPDGSPHPAMVAAMTHIMEHVESLRTKDVDLASALTQEPMPSQVMAAQNPQPAPVDPNVQQGGDPNAQPQPAPNMAGPMATGANGGLPPTGNDGADVAATDMPMA